LAVESGSPFRLKVFAVLAFWAEDHAAAGPLIAALIARKRHGTRRRPD
jgi:hypothetical protein